jgi:hypothetical protein
VQFPFINNEHELNGVLIANIARVLFIIIILVGGAYLLIYRHDGMGMHSGVVDEIKLQIETKESENNVYLWYESLSGIERRKERAIKGEITLTRQDEIDEQVYRRLILEKCRQLRSAGNDTCDGLLMEY